MFAVKDGPVESRFVEEASYFLLEGLGGLFNSRDVQESRQTIRMEETALV